MVAAPQPVCKKLLLENQRFACFCHDYGYFVQHRMAPKPRMLRLCHDWRMHQAAAGLRLGLVVAVRAMRAA